MDNRERSIMKDCEQIFKMLFYHRFGLNQSTTTSIAHRKRQNWHPAEREMTASMLQKVTPARPGYRAVSFWAIF